MNAGPDFPPVPTMSLGTENRLSEQVREEARRAHEARQRRTPWQAAREELLVREKAHTREGDAIAAARRRLPMVELDGAVEVTGVDGPVGTCFLVTLPIMAEDIGEWQPG